MRVARTMETYLPHALIAAVVLGMASQVLSVRPDEVAPPTRALSHRRFRRGGRPRRYRRRGGKPR